jgi:hypothetical protein
MGAYHRGEQAVQEATGERTAAGVNARIILDHLPSGARGFVAQQGSCVLAHRSAPGEVWVGLFVGAPGFATVSADLRTVALDAADTSGLWRTLPSFDHLAVGDEVGLLFLDLSTRRRRRTNGPVAALEPGRLVVQVTEAYANCPKYIQRRRLSDRPPTQLATIEEGTGIDPIRGWIESADTFVGSGQPGEDGRESSRRPTGFVRVSAAAR